jgi:hypothetical protein
MRGGAAGQYFLTVLERDKQAWWILEALTSCSDAGHKNWTHGPWRLYIVLRIAKNLIFVLMAVGNLNGPISWKFLNTCWTLINTSEPSRGYRGDIWDNGHCEGSKFHMSPPIRNKRAW